MPGSSSSASEWSTLGTVYGVRVSVGATENARHENAAQRIMQGWKMQEWKMRHKTAGLENARLENVAQKCRT